MTRKARKITRFLIRKRRERRGWKRKNKILLAKLPEEEKRGAKPEKANSFLLLVPTMGPKYGSVQT